MIRSLSIAALIIVAMLNSRPLMADDARGWLHLTGNDYLAGTLLDSEAKSDGKLNWRHPSFATPFRFDLERIRCLTLDRKNRPQTTDGSMIVITRGGDRLLGKLVKIDADTVRIETASVGALSIPRSELSHLLRVSDTVPAPYAGPINVDRWSTWGDLSDWADYGGRLSTTQQHASLYQDNLLYPRSEIELSLSWKGQPNFTLSLGIDCVGDEDDLYESFKQGFRLEAWDDDIVLLRESDEAADVVSLAKVKLLDSRLQMRITLDRNNGRCTVTPILPTDAKVSPQAFTMALREADDPPPLGAGIAVTNQSGSLCIESLQITPLPAVAQTASAGEQDTLQLTDGEQVVGQLVETRDSQWVVQQNDAAVLIDSKTIATVRFADPQEDTNPTELEEGENEAPLFHFITENGSRLVGYWINTERDTIVVQRPTDETPISIDTNKILRVESLSHASPTKPQSTLRQGTLQFDDGQLKAWLVPSNDDKQSAPIQFATAQCEPATPISRFSGQLTYRKPIPKLEPKPIPPARPRRARAAVPANLGVRILGGLAKAFGNNENTQQVRPRAMHLWSGEIIPCSVKSIDDNGVQFESKMTEKSTIEHQFIRAIRVNTNLGEPELSDQELERLMTVPRVGKKRPPTHLLIAKNGDVLRCRLLKMDDRSLTVELRLETVEIERSLVSQIIWLSNPDFDDETAVDLTSPEQSAPMIRAVLQNGLQVSTIPTEFTNGEIIGTHPVLGDTKINLAFADALIIGNFSSPYDADQPFQKWKLKNAPEPMIADSESGSTGLESPLVGKQAPDFSLETLEGETFQVSKNEGKVIVLDFWASWCGPCMQAMPLIDSTVSEFDPTQVMLVAVNLEETREPIERTLNRLNISPSVAMDRDGVAARRYQADTIPQTVVIDQKGNVTRIFVGAHGDLQERLRETIKGLLD